MVLAGWHPGTLTSSNGALQQQESLRLFHAVDFTGCVPSARQLPDYCLHVPRLCHTLLCPCRKTSDLMLSCGPTGGRVSQLVFLVAASASQAHATCLSIRLLDVYRLNYFIACSRKSDFCICDIDELLRLMSSDV